MGITFWYLLRQAMLCYIRQNLIYMFKFYSEFKKVVDICGKFKITEAKNENSQNLYSGKIPKLRQIFGKIWLGKFRARAPTFRKHGIKHN